MAPRILLCGDALGRLNQLFKRVQSVSKSAGPFDALLCVGQFFPDSPELLAELSDYVEGRVQIPLPTYFIGDYGIGATKVLSAASRDASNQGFKMDGLKICDNLYWLRGSGKFTLLGLSVAYLSGKESSDSQQFGKYTQDDVDALRALAEDPGVVDLFLTNEWPTGVTNRSAASDIPVGISDFPGSNSTVSELVMEIKPRYHVAGSKGVFYTREPYVNTDAVHVTRFLGLAQVGNKDKQKFLHAISPTATSTMSEAELSVKPPNTTLSPYTLMEGTTTQSEAKKRSSDSDADSQYWRYDVKRQKNGASGDKLCFKFIYSGSCQHGDTCHFKHSMEARESFRKGVCLDLIIKGKCERGPDCTFKHDLQDEDQTNTQRRPRSSSSSRSKECWFCLSSPNVESHLIISVGENFYCALPKGPLVEDHVLIIPIEHLPNTVSLSPECKSELVKFQNSLKMFYKSQGKEAVFFELVSTRGTHANLQVVPVPSSKANLLPNIFNLAAEKLGFTFESKKFSNTSDGRNFLTTEYDKNFGFFYVELPDGSVLSHMVKENEKFPPQFGREVLAGLLKIADRADWRNCTVSKEEETTVAEEFKNQFKAFDHCQ